MDLWAWSGQQPLVEGRRCQAGVAAATGAAAVALAGQPAIGAPPVASPMEVLSMHESITMLTGNVATEPRHLETDSGVHITSFRLASTPRRFKDGSYVDLDTSYVTVTCWRFAAQNAAASIRKGDPVLVMGALRVREWEREGRTGVTTEIDAKAIGHDLSRGVSRFTKVVRTRSVGSDEDEAFLARIDEGGDDAHRDSAQREGEGPDESVDLRTGEIHQANRPGGEHAPNGESRKVRQQREAATSAA